MPTYADIHPDAFVHPEDRAALQALRDVPGLGALLKALSGGPIERHLHADLSHTAVQLGRAQYPSLYRMVEQACEALDVPVPDAYLIGGYQVNASAFGMERYTVRLYQGLVDLLDEREVAAVVGHEIGHIACEHMLYKSLAAVLAQLGGVALGRVLGPVAGLVTQGLELALYRWSRAAEYSCDRAALLVIGDPEVCASALAKLGGPSLRYRDEFNLDEALSQARQYAHHSSATDRLIYPLTQLGRPPPEPLLRAGAILEWAESPEYAAIKSGRYLRRSQVAEQMVRPQIEGMERCKCCAEFLHPKRNRCQQCGCHRAAALQQRCENGHVGDVRWTTCWVCDAALG